MLSGISVCIPAYNRSKYLAELLDSILIQKEFLHEIVICEDLSPERELISFVVNRYIEKHPGLILYYENKQNLGFDKNIRELVSKSTGSHCLFLGNDDFLCPGALKIICGIIHKHPDVGVILRGYGWFNGSPNNVVQVVKYFTQEQSMAPGLSALAFFYRRSCVLAGLTIARVPALALETTKFDGTLFYQLHLVGNIILKHGGVFTPELIALCRADEKPDFGHSASEKGKYTPGEYTIDARLHMMSGIVNIAKDIDKKNPGALNVILKDISNYSFPWLAYHADKGRKIFKKYYVGLSELGLGKYRMFHVYYYLIIVFGAGFVERAINFARNGLGYTPRFFKSQK